MVCVGMKPHGVNEEQVKLKTFPFSLKGVAKTWLFYFLPGSIWTWNDIKKIFLEKYFPASRVANIRKEIYGIRQSHGETFSKYWERFEQLNALIIRYRISCSFNISKKDWCLLTVVSLMRQVEGHWQIRHPRLHANWSQIWQPTRNNLARMETSQANE